MGWKTQPKGVPSNYFYQAPYTKEHIEAVKAVKVNTENRTDERPRGGFRGRGRGMRGGRGRGRGGRGAPRGGSDGNFRGNDNFRGERGSRGGRGAPRGGRGGFRGGDNFRGNRGAQGESRPQTATPGSRGIPGLGN